MNKFHVNDIVTDNLFEMKITNVYQDDISKVYFYECVPTKFALLEKDMSRIISENKLKLVNQGENNNEAKH